MKSWFASRYGMAPSVMDVKVPCSFNSLAMRCVRPIDARMGPDPTLTRRTPNRSSSGMFGTPAVARMLSGPFTAFASRPIVS